MEIMFEGERHYTDHPGRDEQVHPNEIGILRCMMRGCGK
jgi:hypothetical protein